MLTSTPPESSREIYDWILGFTNLERGQTLRSFRLDRMSALADLAGHPEKCAPAIHVAGSKGKGSVTGMIASILDAAGIKTARYTSPHVNDFRERLTLGNEFFDEKIYVQAGKELWDLVKSLPDSSRRELFDPNTPAGEEPSFFELITMWFFLCARLARSGALAVETGMGGRLDATNILEPLVSVITIIELEHTDYLGKTITAIAEEKAGIIKQGMPLVLAKQCDEALNVFRKHAAGKNSPLLYLPDITAIENIKVKREGTSFTLNTQNEFFHELFVPVPGVIMAHNAGLAILAVKTAYPGIDKKNIQKGLAHFSVPARFERVSENPVVIIDGAHTPRSVELCLNTFTDLYGAGGILVFGCAEGKDILSMAELCVPCFNKIIITTPGNFKKSNPAEIYEVFKQQVLRITNIPFAMGVNSVPELLFIPDTGTAIETVRNLALETELPVLGTGSFYLAAEIRSRFL